MRDTRNKSAVGGPSLRHDGTVGTDGRWAGRRVSHGPGGRAVLARPVRRRLRGHPEGPREGPGDVRGGRRGPNMTERWFLGGLCWLLPRRRRQPSGSGAHAEPVFPTKGEAATEGGAADTPWRLRRSCHPTQLVGTTVYTNAPKRLREAVFADLCTLLRPHGPSRDRVGHESHDVDGPLALVIPGCSDLRPTPPGR